MDVQSAKDRSGPLADKVHRGATLFSYLVICVMIGVFYIHVQAFRNAMHRVETSPHYRSVSGDMNHCDDCHAYPADRCEDHEIKECLECHKDDGKAKKLKYDSILVLCTKCHAPDVYLVYTHDGKKKEIDLILYHPYGQGMTDVTFPETLPLDKNGRLTCVTCHDVHMQDTDRMMLRIFQHNEALPRNVAPLCLDCHHQNGVL